MERLNETSIRSHLNTERMASVIVSPVRGHLSNLRKARMPFESGMDAYSVFDKCPRTGKTMTEAEQINHTVQFYLLDTVDSTNRFLKDQPSAEGISICCAETQTHGRGRFGRTWHSPLGENIYFSARLRINGDLSQLSSLGLVVSLAVIKTLEELDLNDGLMIKWPNDILWHQKKLSGCLIELITEPNAPAEVIIGIGINVNSKTDEHPLPDKLWCSLFDITGQLHDRNRIIGLLIGHLNQHLTQLIANGFTAFLKSWEDVDGLKGQSITVSNPTGTIHGTANGVDHMGRLILVDTEGQTHTLSSGDTSISSSTKAIIRQYQ